MREKGIAGALLTLGVLIAWAGFSGRMGFVLAAVLCPQSLVLPDSGALDAPSVGATPEGG